MEQNKINKRSGRKCQDFEKAEQDFQEAQTAWEEDENNVEAWKKMFELINVAVFNCINKKLEHILEKEEIEGRALDITCTIMSGLKKKRDNQAHWLEEKELIEKELSETRFYKKLSLKNKVIIHDEVLNACIGKKLKWKIDKVSSYVYLPCLAIYKKQLAFEDQLLGQDSYEPSEEDLDNENYHPIVTDWEYKEGFGFYE